MKLLLDQITHPDEGTVQTTAQLGFIPGVYFLLSWEEEVLYVGQSRNIHGRLNAHHYDGIIPFQKVAWIEVEINRLLIVEAEMIKLYSPRFNSPQYRREFTASEELRLSKVEF